MSRFPLPTLRLLLVADSPADAALVERMLAGRFPAPYEVVLARDVQSARARVDEATPDLVVLDLRLPDSSGLETFAALHRAARRVPIVVLSGLDDEALAEQAVAAGAEDYLIKSSLEPGALVRSLRFALERSRRREAEHDLQQAHHQFRVMSEVQQRLFPRGPVTLPGFDIAGAVFPAEQASGDYFDFIPLPDGTLGLVVGDVSGHGLGASLLMAETHAYLQALADAGTPVSEILTRTNRFIYHDCPEDHFVTLFFGRLCPRTRTVSFAAAGHVGFRMGQSGEVQRLGPTGIPLGLVSEAPVPEGAAARLESGDLLIIPTDGIPETPSRTNELFGFSRMWHVIHSLRRQPAAEIIDGLQRAAREFAAGTPQRDDMTAIVVKVLPW
jgi:serine phosphatase RsbU (regulator of sigma subunit)